MSLSLRLSTPTLSVIGCGWVFENGYLPHFLAPEGCPFRVVALFDADSKRAAKFADTLSAAFCRDARDAIHHADATLILTPNPSHVEIAEIALGAGKPCLIEKPACVDGADARRLVLAARRGRTFAKVAACCLYRKDVKWLLSKLEDLKPVRRIELLWRRRAGVPAKLWHTAAQSKWSGVLSDLGFHLIDIAGLALNYPDAVPLFHEAWGRRGRVMSSAAFYGSQGAVFCAAPYDVYSSFSIGDVEIALSVAWAGESRGDRTEISIEGGGGIARLNGLFGFSLDAFYEEVVCDFISAGDADVDSARFPIGPSQHADAFGFVLTDFREAMDQRGCEHSQRQMEFSAVITEAIAKRISADALSSKDSFVHKEFQAL